MACQLARTFLRKPFPTSSTFSNCFRYSLSSITPSQFYSNGPAVLSLAHPSVQRLLQEINENSKGKNPGLNHVVKAIIERQNEVRELVTMGKENRDFKEIAEADAEKVKKVLKELEMEFFSLVVEPDKMDNCTEIILEVSAGVGGQEAMLFTSELLDMYYNYSTNQGWQCEIAAEDKTEIGGLRHGSLAITGPSAYKTLKFEGGVHRVQRVPKTEKSGRIHTSASSVAILPMPKEVDVNINPQDLKIESKRASGAGGQHVNKTESAIRITHLPSGIVVECQTQRSQIQNKSSAMKTLYAKLYQRELDKQTNQITTSRKLQVGGGGRNEKIRTYNYVQDRVTDHRIGLTIYNLRDVLEGGDSFQDILAKLEDFSMEERLAEMFK